jgi:hypothetical protein
LRDLTKVLLLLRWSVCPDGKNFLGKIRHWLAAALQQSRHF